MQTDCRICGGSGYLKTRDGVVSRCACRLEIQSQVQMQALFERANLPAYPDWAPDLYIGNKSRDNMRKIQKFVKEFRERFNNQSLYWHGPNSTQKTTSATWVARELLKAGVTVQYVRMQSLVRDLLQGEVFDKPTSTVDTKKYYDTDLLIVDESFDTSKVTVFKSGYQIPFLDSFLRERLEIRRRSTIFVSNVPIEQIDTFSPSLRALVERCTAGSVFLFEDRILKDQMVSKDIWAEG